MLKLVDLPPELFDAIFIVLDDHSQRSVVGTCRVLRSRWLEAAWNTLTFTGPRVRSQLSRFVSWVDNTQRVGHLIQNTQNLFIRACLLEDALPLGSPEGEQNTDIQDDDIADLLVRIGDNLKLLAIDLPPTPEDQLFDKTLSRIARLGKLERLFLGRVKVHDGYDVECDYTNLKEATMIWCHGIVEQKLLIDQYELQHLDVHDSWDIGNLSNISHQWHNLKSFRFSAVDHTYATKILESGRGAMTSLEEVSIEVPMTNTVFFRIVSELSNYPVRRLHLCISGTGLEVFHPTGLNCVPDDFGPNWLAYISNNLKGLEELVLDYRTAGHRFDLEWPGDQTMYAGALAFAHNLHTLVISVHALPKARYYQCRETAQMYFEHIPSLQMLHFPARPVIPQRSLESRYLSTGFDVPHTVTRGYNMRGRPGQAHHTEGLGDLYRPFWITCGPDVAVDRHRRGGGLRIVANNHMDESPDDVSDVLIFDDILEDFLVQDTDSLTHDMDFFDYDDVDLGLWFPDPGTEDEDDDDGDWTSDDSQDMDHAEDTPLPTSEEWMEGVTIGMSNMHLRISQLNFSELDRHSSSSNDALEDINDSDLSADL